MSKSKEMGEKELPPSPEDAELLSTLSKKKFWTSEELQGLLDQELKTRQHLAQQKETVGNEVELLSVDRKRTLKSELDDLQKSFVKLRFQIKKVMKDKLPGRLDQPDFYQNVQKADELEKASAYLQVFKFIKFTSGQIEANLESGLEREAIDLYHRLKRIEMTYLDITNCSHLQKYGRELVTYWELRLTEKLVKDFEALLKTFGWPMRLKVATPSLEVHEQFHRTILNLSKISSNVNLPEDAKSEKDANSSAIEGFPEPLLPVKIMMKPIKTRFKYHFFSDKPTSESTRPDWYFCQVKIWLRELIPFVRTHLEPVSVSEVEISSVIEFTRSISEMLIFKVESQLEEEIGDGVFVKILQESIAYEDDINDLVGSDTANTDTYLPPFVDTIFSKTHILERWLALERKSSLEKLDDMFSSSTAWTRVVVPGPPEIAELFLAVVRCITGRFAHLQQPGQRMQFLKVLLDMLDDFRVRCLQMWKSKTEFDEYRDKDILIDYIIADTLHYVQTTLYSWEDLPFFVSLSFFVDSVNREQDKALKELSSNEKHGNGNIDNVCSPSKGLFYDVCLLYECLGEEILMKWCLNVVRKTKKEVNAYARQKWQTYESPDPADNLSEELLLPIQTLKAVTLAITRTMHSRLALKWLKKFATRIDCMLMETVILPNRFSRPGIERLCFDMRNGIFGTFMEFGINETLFLGCLNSTIKILQMSTGEAMLLYDTLMNGTFEMHELTLAELGITICQSEVIKILRARCDLHL